MSNDVVVDIPIEDIRAGVRAEIASDLGGIAAQVFEKAKSSTAFRDKTGRLRQSIWIYRSKYKDGGYVVYVKAPHSHLVEFGHAVVTKDGKVLEHRVPGKFFLRKARNAVRRKVDTMLQDMMGDPHYGKRC
ncbi:HK97 gp10 family phage protein [Bilophila wadsworthia]|uniref:HK97 gp10 family phage protein n=1 Tax=Bilophila wadsworthia TaxID=35833 RepID=UPI001D0AAF69|nr:HK97 gp10 family phage protein [Bilophila wadsworthia]MCB8573364.1 HK97 gp10 family phage protein [Bilophila wadsworthia]MCC2716355.1 HK97 gp10 family phage protein [Bilophila wadsworthia]